MFYFFVRTILANVLEIDPWNGVSSEFNNGSYNWIRTGDNQNPGRIGALGENKSFSGNPLDKFAGEGGVGGKGRFENNPLSLSYGEDSFGNGFYENKRSAFSD